MRWIGHGICFATKEKTKEESRNRGDGTKYFFWIDELIEWINARTNGVWIQVRQRDYRSTFISKKKNFLVEPLMIVALFKRSIISHFIKSCVSIIPLRFFFRIINDLAKNIFQELYQSSISSFYDIFRITIKEAIHVLQNVFDEFDHLSFPHRVGYICIFFHWSRFIQKILFKHFLGRFCMCEGVYLSSKYFKNNLKFVFYTSTS